ncbi:MAG: LPS translocon maturation chaperone LptM [Cellvibrionaceae bacterium]
MRVFSIVMTAAVLTLSLAGCGQKGPLYLPQPAEQEQAK